MSNLIVTDSAIAHVNKIRAQRSNEGLYLRLTVEGGGCSGFQYIFGWDEAVSEQDTVFAGSVISDDISLPFLEGSTLDYVVNLMGEDFKITNPNAKSGCGCGTSFAI